jgi:ribonucleoside-diphosphate reductase alpha chain
MRAVQKGEKFKLINPRTDEAEGQLPARRVFDLIAESAWKTGDPGLLFIGEINRKNPTPKAGKLEATNPCGEVPLLSYESCNLGSVNLKRMIKGKQIDWENLARTVKIAVDMLDAIIDVNKYPLPQIAQATLNNRKIGLGVMGFADLLIKMGVPYNSEEALNLGEALMSFVEEEGHARSQFIGRRKGSFPNFQGSIWQKKGYAHLRNATVTTIAPTGTLSLIADCTSGIEPIFATAYVKKVLGGLTLSKKHQAGPATVTAHGISPEWHVRMQAAFQKFTDNAVSKTVNLPHQATVEEIKKIFWLAYDLKCKGITVYRDRSKKEQVLYIEDSGEQCCAL